MTCRDSATETPPSVAILSDLARLLRDGLSTRLSVAVAVAVAALLATGCAPHKIPGTEIDDNDDTRAILTVMENYRKAVEAKDVKGLQGLADDSFKDDGGSSNPDDDLDFTTLLTKLPKRFSRVDELKLDLNVRKIDINKELKTAVATFTYTVSFRMPSLTTRSTSEADIKQMKFRRVKEKEWKIVSGI